MINILWLIFAVWWARAREWLSTRLLRLQLSPEEFDRWSKVKRQVEFYFSDENYCKDKFLLEVAAENSGWIPIDVLLTFPKLKQLGATTILIQQAVTVGSFLKLDSTSLKVKRINEVAAQDKHYIDRSSIYAKVFPTNGEVKREHIEEFLDSKLKPLGLSAQNRTRMLEGAEGRFSGSITVQFTDPETAARVVRHFTENPISWSPEFPNQLTFVLWSEKKRSKKSSSGPPSPRSDIDSNPQKSLSPGELSEEQMKLLNEFRQQYNLNQLETQTLEEAPSRFKYAVHYDYQGKRYSGIGPRLSKKRLALRAAEYELCKQLSTVLSGKERVFIDLFKSADHAKQLFTTETVDELERSAQIRQSRQQDEARIKKVFHWIRDDQVEPILEENQNKDPGVCFDVGDLLESVGSRLVSPAAQDFFSALQRLGWSNQIKEYAKQVEVESMNRNNSFLESVLNEDAEEDPDAQDEQTSSLSVSTDDDMSNAFVSQASLEIAGVDIGFWLAENKFVNLWQTANLTSVEFNKNAYLMSMLFMRHKVAYKIKNLLREMAEPAKIECDWNTDNPSYCNFIFSLRSAPKLMHKPPGRALWTRSVDFTPNEAWNQASHLRLKFGSIQSVTEAGKLPALLWLCDSLVRVGMAEPSFGMKYDSIIHTELPPFVAPASLASLPMSLKFKLQCLVSKRIISPYDITDELVSVITGALSSGVSEKSVCSILQSIENANRRRFDLPQAVSKAVATQKYSQLKGPTDNSAYVLIPHVTFTPLRMWCEGPVAEISNRVIRAFPEHRDRFIRVSFKDEDGKTSIKGAGRALIRDRILRLLETGFQLDVVGMKYSWLVFSSGQLRGHKTWFFSETSQLSCDKIRSWMGNFDRIFNVALFSSRLGQALSSTYPTIEVVPEEMIKVPDVRRNGYNFSDGVGTISLELAKEVAQRLPLKNKDKPPSAFQIRLGGIKGVVSVDPRLQGRVMKVRPSMDKFPSPHCNMEVISWAKSIPAHLNRQLILILSDLGVPDQVFIDAQETALQRVASVKSLGDSKSTEATNMQIDLLESTWRVKNKPESLPARAIKMMRAGFTPDSEPYLFNVLRVLNLRRFQDLRVLARIPVDDGIYCLGIMDEFDALDYGQIFLQRTLSDGSLEVVKGKVVVSRSPALHPGDIRILDAIDTPEIRQALGHYVDCVVFPQRGPRPHPHECSGGDLDGDTYLCLWGQRWIPKIMDTPPFEAHETVSAGTVSQDDNPVCMSEVRQFFVDYIYEDKLGNIADAHMYHADKSEKGVFDPICLELAKWHNVAVDAPKTGKQVPPLECLKISEYPDHACPTSLARTYPSKKVLGKLFRLADSQITLFKSLGRATTKLSTSLDNDLIIDGYEEFLEDAKRLRDSYSVELNNLMKQFEMGDEFQALSGDAMWESKAQRRDWENLRDGVESILQELRDHFRKVFFDTDDELLLRKKASAWYYATYAERMSNPSTGEISITFPWVVDDILCSIKSQRRNQTVAAESTI